jgi:hypothetical protein
MNFTTQISSTSTFKILGPLAGCWIELTFVEPFKISSSLWLVTEHFKHDYWARYQENSVHSKRALIFYEYHIRIFNLNPSLNLNSVSRSQHQYSLHFFSWIRLLCRNAMHNFFETLSSVLQTSKRYGANVHALLSLMRWFYIFLVEDTNPIKTWTRKTILQHEELSFWDSTSCLIVTTRHCGRYSNYILFCAHPISCQWHIQGLITT